MKYQKANTVQWLMSSVAIFSLSFVAACGDEDGGEETELDASGGYLAIVAEPPQQVVSGTPFAVEAKLIDEDGDSIALEGMEVTAQLNQNEFSGGDTVSTTDDTGAVEFEFVIEVAADDYEIEVTTDDENIEEASTKTDLFEVVAAAADADNSTITADGVGIADGVTPLAVTIELADLFGNPIIGVVPKFEASGTGNQYGDCPETDDEGIANCAMTATEVGDKTLETVEPVEVIGDTVAFVDCDEDREPFGGGDGSSAHPHRICAPHHLDVAGLDPAIVYDSYILYRDIDMADVDDFIPIGPSGSDGGFRGTLDGGGFAVQNLVIDRPDSNSAGLLRSVGEDGVVKNLILEDINFTGKEHIGALTVTNYGTITDTHVIGGTITADGRSGGFVATNNGTVSDSSTSAHVVNKGSISGGFAGNNTGTIIDSHAKGNVEGSLWRTGGFVGSNSGTAEGAGVIKNCYATGHVVGGEFTGGLVGWSDGDITNSYATGDVAGDDRVGGLVGRINEDATVAGSYSSGDVIGQGWVGGLVGLSQYGAINTSYSTSSVEGSGMTGGLVGRIVEGSVADSYAAGNVENTSSYSGALIGSNWESSVIASYWDEDTTGIGSSEGGSARRTGEFEDVESFEDWDFIDVWTIGEAPDGEQRPILQWQE